MGYSDADILERLLITEDGLKKRWRAAYTRAQAAEPQMGLLGAAPQAKCKLLLDALRFRMEEIRPYLKSPKKPTPGE